jgi:general stress protein 26
MDQDANGKRDEALSFLVGHSTGVLATVSKEGKPRARLVYYASDDAFRVHFITLANTRKAEDLAAHSHAAFVVAEAAAPRTVQIEGAVEDLTDSATVDPMLADFVRMLMSNTRFGAPLARFDTATLKFYRLTPDWVRWGDFTFGRGTDTVLTVINPIEEDED